MRNLTVPFTVGSREGAESADGRFYAVSTRESFYVADTRGEFKARTTTSLEQCDEQVGIWLSLAPQRTEQED